MKSIILIFAALVVFNRVNSQFAITHLGQVYTENFDSLGTVTVVWNNEAALQGWSFVYSTNGMNAGFVNTLFANAGEYTIPRPLNLGSYASPDRALGAAAGKYTIYPTNEFYYGARFINNSTETIPYVNVNYFGEQWRDSYDNIQTINFFYRIEGNNFLGDPQNVGWTAVPSLDFSSLHNTELPNEALNGNSAANRINLSDDIFINLQPGQQFWIRWSHTKFAGLSLPHILGIDDLTLTFTNNAINTNTINTSNTVLAVSAEFKNKKLRFSSSRGFKLKVYLRSTNTLSKASYTAYSGSGTNAATNLTFVNAGSFIPLSKGPLFRKKAVNVIVKSKKSKAGVGIAPGISPVTVILKIDGTQGSQPASALITNTFGDVRVR